MRTKKLLLVVFITAIPFTLAGCILDLGFSFSLSDFRYRFDDSFEADLDGITEVSVSILNGPISVSTWENDSIDIEVDERIKASDSAEAEELADAVKLVGSRNGNVLEIELDYGEYFSKRRRHYSGLEIRLPARLTLKMNTTNGKIGIDEMQGDVSARTTNGAIEIDGCGGNALLSTTNGPIRTGVVGGELIAESTNGSLNLKALEGPVRAGTTNGRIEVSIRDSLRGDVKLSSTNGSISLDVHPGSSFKLEAVTSNGRVRESLDLNRFRGDYNRRKTRLDGKYDDGDYIVRLKTTNGSININN